MPIKMMADDIEAFEEEAGGRPGKTRKREDGTAAASLVKGVKNREQLLAVMKQGPFVAKLSRPFLQLSLKRLICFPNLTRWLTVLRR